MRMHTIAVTAEAGVNVNILALGGAETVENHAIDGRMSVVVQRLEKRRREV